MIGVFGGRLFLLGLVWLFFVCFLGGWLFGDKLVGGVFAIDGTIIMRFRDGAWVVLSGDGDGLMEVIGFCWWFGLIGFLVDGGGGCGGYII